MSMQRSEPPDGRTEEHQPLAPAAAAGVSSLSGRAPAAFVVLALYLVTAAPALAGGTLPNATLVASALLASALVALTVIDIESYRLPDALTLPLALAGLGFTALFDWDSLLAHLVGALVGYAALSLVAALYQHLRGRAGLGLGDAKLLAAAGAWLGAPGLPMVILIASLSALAWVGALALRGRAVTRTTVLPFGPFLALGFWLVWLYG